jgi:PKD repeat protein
VLAKRTLRSRSASWTVVATFIILLVLLFTSAGPAPFPTAFPSSEAGVAAYQSVPDSSLPRTQNLMAGFADQDSGSSTPYWTNLTASPAPPAREGASMTYDPVDGYVVLFGGQNARGNFMNDTWIFRDGDWSNITSTAGAAPPARTGMSMTYDAADHYVLAFGGQTLGACSKSPGSTCNDTWSFTDGKWEKISAIGSPAPNFFDDGQELVYDEADSYVVLTNGAATWKYQGGVWTPFCGTNCSNFIPGPDLRGIAAYDARDGYVLFLGSNTLGNGLPGGSYSWTFSGGKWTNITASAGGAPPPRFAAMMTYDSSASGILLFGGYGNNSSEPFLQPLNDTWFFQNGTWQAIGSGTSPPAAGQGTLADDPTDSVAVLFGGGSESSVLADTWVWSASPPISAISINVTPSVPLPGAPATFAASFRGGTGPFNYSWKFGDGNSSTTPNPTHSFASTGYFVVELWVNDSSGHSANSTLRVHVYVPLSISVLQVTPNPATLGVPVNFTAIATGGTPPYTYSWNFGDGGVGGNLSKITHVYTTNGPFTAEASVQDAAGGIVDEFLNISIKLQALAGASVGSETESLTVAFVGQADGGIPPYMYNWSFGDGSTSSEQNPSHSYASYGRYTVSLTVTDGRGNRSMSTLSVQVGAAPGTSGMGSSWYPEFVVVAAIAAIIAVAWGATSLYKRSQRREGEKWVEELTQQGEPPKTDGGR